MIDGPRGAAIILGLHPNTLRSRMQKLRIKKLTMSAREPLLQPVKLQRRGQHHGIS